MFNTTRTQRITSHRKKRNRYIYLKIRLEYSWSIHKVTNNAAVTDKKVALQPEHIWIFSPKCHRKTSYNRFSSSKPLYFDQWKCPKFGQHTNKIWRCCWTCWRTTNGFDKQKKIGKIIAVSWGALQLLHTRHFYEKILVHAYLVGSMYIHLQINCHYVFIR